LQRVSRNMRSSEERLANKELTDGTRQIQQDILKDLDSLIRMAENPPPEGGGGGGEENKDQKDNQGNQAGAPGSKPSGTLMGQRQRSQQRGSQTQMAGGKSGAGNGNQQQPNDLSKGNGNQGGGGGQDRPGEMNRNADLFKDLWGNMPETLRAELNAYG